MTAPMEMPADVRLMTLATQALAALFVAMGLGGLAWWAARHPAWSVAGISVHGDVAHQSVVTLRTHLAQRVNGPFLMVDLQEVRRLFESVPWVRQAVVQREFPNRLRVTLTEHQAVAWWGRQGEGRLLSALGEVFEANPDDSEADQMVELAGPDDQAAAVLVLYRALAPAMERLGLPMRRLELGSRGGWRLDLDNGAVLHLGRGEPAQVAARVQQFVVTLPQLLQRYGGRDLESADLRYPNGYAVKLRGVATLEMGDVSGNKR